MPKYAYPSPNLEQLEAAYPLEQETVHNVTSERAKISDALSKGIGFVAIIGPCGMTDAADIIDKEGDALRELQESEDGLFIEHRIPPWKPRSKER